jgi:hypothetical protein
MGDLSVPHHGYDWEKAGKRNETEAIERRIAPRNGL